MKLKTGKDYRDAKGDRVRIVGARGVYALSEAGSFYCWDGRAVSAEHHDIAAEWTEQPQPEAIPHADLIRAVLDGKTVQWRNVVAQKWLNLLTARDAIHSLAAFPDREYRLKPENIVRHMGISEDGSFGPSYASRMAALKPIDWGPFVAVLRIELDADTRQVVSAKTEAV